MTNSSQPINLADIARTTPFPNYLLDTAMPALTDTQWRLLCVVVRQTLGWQARPSGQADTAWRKSGDWLSHGQLKARTGRSSAVLSRALDSLVRRSLIEVWDGRQQPLLTPRSRQRHGGMLYFRLGSAVLAHILKDYSHATAGPDAVGSAGRPSAESGTRFSERGLQKVRTTKATPTKYLSNDKEREGSGFLYRTGEAAEGGSANDLPNPDVKRFLAAYVRLFRRHTVSGDPPAMAWGKDGRLVKELLNVYSYDRLERLLTRVFESRDPWLIKRGYSLSAFKDAINTLLMGEGDGAHNANRPVLRTGRWSKAGEDSDLKADRPATQ